MHFLVHYFGLICSLFCGDSFSLSVIPCWSLLLFGVQRIQSLVIAWLVYSHLWSRWQVSQNLIYIYIYNLLNNLCFLIKSCQLMVTLWSLLSSLFHRQDICSSGNGPWNGAGAGIFTHLYLCLKDTTGHWSAIQNILRTFFCILDELVDGEILFSSECRIVLERPEYGYATYFFELVDLLPLDWQIKRLVTTMKLTSCGRINLIENKSLTVMIPFPSKWLLVFRL